MSEIKWEDPPAGTVRGIAWESIFQQLRGRPGSWALVAEDYSTSQTTRIKRGMIPGTTPGEFEAVAREVKNGKGKIYARYVGEVVE